MRLGILGGAIAAGLIALASSAYAAPIAAGSALSLNGSDTYTPTSITFIGPANVGGATGSFTALGTCTACVTMAGSLSTTTTLPITLYTAAHNGLTSTLVVSSDTFVPGANTLTVNGTGTLTLTGFDATPGTFVLTTQGPNGVQVTFSVTSTASAVPEPASLTLLGTALLGLGLFRLRRKQV